MKKRSMLARERERERKRERDREMERESERELETHSDKEKNASSRVRVVQLTSFPKDMKKYGTMNLITTWTIFPVQNTVHWEGLSGFMRT